MTQIKFAPGVFIEFTATRSFGLGNSGVKVVKGTQLEFDGSTVRYAGAEYPFPQLRGALTTGWIVQSDDYDESDPSYGVRQSANIQVRPAVEPTNPADRAQASRSATTVASSDEHIVMGYKNHATQTQQQNFRQASVTTPDGQEGIAVRTLSTPSRQRTELTAASAGSALRAAASVQIVPGRGITQDEMLERMTDDQVEQYLAKKEAIKSTYPSSEPKVVGKVGKVSGGNKVSHSEGMKATQSVGGGTSVGGEGDGEIVGRIASAQQTHIEDGITFTNTIPASAPKQHRPRARAAAVEAPKLDTAGGDLRRRIALALCADFPISYDFTAPAKKKLARLQADFEDRLDVLRAVWAAETDDFKAQIEAEFPQAFA
jgi:hypothetical protein